MIQVKQCWKSGTIERKFTGFRRPLTAAVLRFQAGIFPMQFVADQVLVEQAVPGLLRFSLISLTLPILHTQFRS